MTLTSPTSGSYNAGVEFYKTAYFNIIVDTILRRQIFRLHKLVMAMGSA